MSEIVFYMSITSMLGYRTVSLQYFPLDCILHLHYREHPDRNITARFGISIKQDKWDLQRVMPTELPDLQSICSKRCWTKARKIMKDLSHPNSRLLTMLHSVKCFPCLKTHTSNITVNTHARAHIYKYVYCIISFFPATTSVPC